MAQGSPQSLQVRVARIGDLPEGFDRLRSEAASEALQHIEAVWREWQDDTNRFKRPGEILAVATIDHDLAGLGGNTQDFVDPAWLRMRRFYVRPACRRCGIGRSIAEFVLDHALPLSREIALYAEGLEAKAFWLRLGFVEIERENTTHVFRKDLRMSLMSSGRAPRGD